MWSTNLALSSDIYVFKISSYCSGKEIYSWIELLIWKQLVLAQFMVHRFESNKIFSHLCENHSVGWNLKKKKVLLHVYLEPRVSILVKS